MATTATAQAAASAKPLKVLMLDTQGEYFSWAHSISNMGHRWDLLRVDSARSMIDYLRENPYQAVVVAPSTKLHQDQDCLIKAMQLQPRAVRVVLPGLVGSSTQISRTTDLAHRVFGDQDSNESIANAIEIQVKLNRLINKAQTRDFLRSGGPLPSPPLVYKALSEALNNELSNAAQIAAIVQRDPALVAKVLKMVNSAFFGLQRQISHIGEAVALLGVRMLRGLALSGHLASLYPQHDAWAAFSFDRVNERSLLVARLAMQIAKDMQCNIAVQDQAFLAGLLHDIGTLFIASQDPARYLEVMTLSGQKHASICVVEKKLLGFFHGEIGAYLMAHWGLAPQVIEAVLLHHTPQLCGNPHFSPLTAVHIADALLPAVHNATGADLSNPLNKAYLTATGAHVQLGQWQTRAASLLRAGPGPH